MAIELIDENKNGCSYLITAGFVDSNITDRGEQNIITEFLKKKLIKLESQINKYGYTMNKFFDE